MKTETKQFKTYGMQHKQSKGKIWNNESLPQKVRKTSNK